jgi:DMSO/TMAO reductase YedYZ molybdopterin-dependent catalytic subunit
MTIVEPGQQEFGIEEVQLAARNHGMPLEALGYDVTPVGLHYLLIHFDIPSVDPSAWRLEVGGAVRRPMSLSLQDLRARPRVTVPVTMECAGNGRARLDPRPVSQPWLVEAVGTGEWSGTPVRGLLEEAGIADTAVDVVFTGLDRGIEGEVEQTYERAIPAAEAMRDEPLLAYELNGQPLPPQHGYPLRLVVPGWYGMTQVKWLSRITVLDREFDGYQNARAYRFKSDEDDPGNPVTRMMPRALMVPPGIPEFLTRARTVEAGPQRLTGKAWSGWGPIASVAVSVDGGATWAPAELKPSAAPSAWHPWWFEWDAHPGEYELSCAATDTAGNAQPVGQAWNFKGYANNEVQRIPVTVRAQS